MHHAFQLAALMVISESLPATAQPVTSPVTSQMLVEGLKDPARWLMFEGD